MHDRTYGLLKEARARWRDFDDASRKDPGMYERFRRNNRETSKKYFNFLSEQNNRIMSGKRAVAGDFEAAKKQKAVERLGIKLNLSPRAERIYRKSLNGLSPRELENIRTINGANFEQAAKESDFRRGEAERLKAFMNAGKGGALAIPSKPISSAKASASVKTSAELKKRLALAGGIAAGTAALGGAAYAGKKLYDRHKRKSEEQAEKAAAYYDESQHEKQAYTVEGDRIYLDKDDVTTLHYGVKDKIKDFAKGPAKDFIKGPAKKGVLTAASIVGPPAAIFGAAYGVDKLYQKRLNKKRKEYYARKRAMRQAESEEQAEKAAAYYDEAQYAKEAAIDNYNEACAYEEAALTILDELGYLD